MTTKLGGKTLGRYLRSLRLSRGLTRNDLRDRAVAAGLPISYRNLTRLECDDVEDPKVSTLRAYAAGVGISLRELLPDDLFGPPQRAH